MTAGAIYIRGMGLISALGSGPVHTLRALKAGRMGLRPLSLFTVPADALLPVGEVAVNPADSLPRTHQLACLAADQAMSGSSEAPDAIVLGVTTGGMLTTEDLLAQKVRAPEAYRHHAVNSVAEELARRFSCRGPRLTVSTACSSGAAAIILALNLLRSGMARLVLAGGADGLCRLTYFGFKSLQLIDPAGSRPLDRERRGMSIADGAAMLLLSPEAAGSSGICILGGGLSCDAYHPAAPQPDGRGAQAAVQAALADAGVLPEEIDYINLHGTGTIENDRSEALAVRSLFGGRPPVVSSIKGSLGHSLAAAGAIEAVVTALSVQQGFVPPNAGFTTFDPDLGLAPAAEPLDMPLKTALSNSFGFGGNNAALVIGRADSETACRPADSRGPENQAAPVAPLVVKGYACLSGSGRTETTLDAFMAGKPCSGCLADEQVAAGLPLRTIRRLKRLPKMALALAADALGACPPSERPDAVSFGTGWGAMSETHDFISRLVETDMQFPSPTDFIGSVHNAPAGQIAMMFQATGANITTSGGDYSFEQALLAADLLTRGSSRSILVLGADEAHPSWSRLFDPSSGMDSLLSDGGGAFWLQRAPDVPGNPGVGMELVYYRCAGPDSLGGVDGLLDVLGGAERIRQAYGVVLAGMPAAHRGQAGDQLERFVSRCQYEGPVIDYRRQTGEFATATAVAAAAAVKIMEQGALARPGEHGGRLALEGRDILLLGMGPCVTAIRIFKL